ncbi:MAG: polysaccharide biosynthesis C-terminal domain-containing protein [Cyclobacteriaceae bacterium]|nr:polysaccharide biosynthesis C-terminal domain-containing protein [Cyclobacteriaceae bacterium]
MSKLKKLAGETALYGLGSIIPRMLNFLQVPLYTINMFSEAEYGEITKLYAYVAVVNIIFMFGMETAYFRFATKPGADPKRIFNLAQTSVIAISGSLTILMLFAAMPIASALQASSSQFIIWLVITMFIDALVAIPFAQLRLQKKAFQFAFAKIMNVVIVLVLNYYFLKINYNPSIGVGYVFIATLIANSLFILFFIKTLLTWRPAWDKTISPQMFGYAYPVMITGIAGMINEMFSRSMLDWWLPENFYKGVSQKDAGGIFGAAYKYAVFMNLGVQAFRYAAEPFFFSNAQHKDSPGLFAQVNHFFVIVCCVVWLSISINMDILKYLVGENFWLGLPIVPVLLLAYLFLGVYYNMSAWFKLTDKTHYGTIITIIGALITVAGNYFLIPVAGFMGSAIAALACYATMAAICFGLGQKYYPIPYWISRDVGYIVFTGALINLLGRIQFSSQWYATGFHTVVILAFVALVYGIEKKNLSQSIHSEF